VIALEDAHAIVIGIANYAQINKLPPAVLADARDTCSLLVDPLHCGYPKGNVRLLLDGEATGAAIRRALADVAATSTPPASATSKTGRDNVALDTIAGMATSNSAISLR
jgi:hypothetical protein